ncbi:uncharacterized protein [Amphiura filiformis]|uniref:uncharacterized protein n=1 Tax=Amphiura filiformis TaxID=82378 RepID=UPI003B214CEA
MKFHSKCHGRNIILSEGATVATRIASFGHGIVFGDRPVEPGEKITIEIKSAQSGWSGALRFGFTNHNPDTIDPKSLPKYAIPDLIGKPGYWASDVRDENRIKTGITLFYLYTAENTVKYSTDGQVWERVENFKKKTFVNVNTDEPMWPLIDVYGNTTSVKLVAGLDNVVFNSKATKTTIDSQSLTEPTSVMSVGIKTFDDLKPGIFRAMLWLKSCGDDFSTQEATKALSVIERSCEYGECPCENQHLLGMYLKIEGFAQLFAKIWKWLLRFLERDNWRETGFTNLRLLVRIGVNFTNHCPAEFGADLGVHGCIPLLLEGLRKLKKYFNKGSEIALLRGVVGDLFGILHNSIHKCESNREIYRKARAVEDLTEYLKYENASIKLQSLLILAYVVNESESSILTTAEGGIAKLVELLKLAVNSEDHKALFESTTLFSAFELLDCLNHLAINDNNKREIEKQGGVPAIVRMLQDDFSEEEQSVAARVLWNLSFVESIRKSDLLQTTVKPLEKLLKSTDKNLQDSSAYALWQIKGANHGNIPIREHPTQGSPLYEASIKRPKQLRSQKTAQIMISYQWDSKPTATKLRDSLVNSGYRVWMDDTHMTGDILAAMAEAVEKSHVVLICMSEKYKNSQSCRSEAEYAYKLKKAVIPLLIEDGYQPDGWLGLLQGTKLYYNFSSDALVKTELPRLVTAIKECIPSDKDETEGPPVPPRHHRGVRSHGGTAPPPTSKPSASNWTESDVQEWLKKNKLDDLCDLMESYDGEHLEAMYKQYREDGRNFEKDMKSDYQMNSRVYLKFTVALGKLFKE